MERAQAARAVEVMVLGRPAESVALSLHREKRQLEDAELDCFLTLMEQMWAYYPHQEFSAETVQGYQFDMERLAVRHGLDRVKEVLLDLRLRAGQKFFPHPVQVLEELEAMEKKERAEQIKANPYVPDPACNHRIPGWTRTKDQDGDDVMGRCECWKRWRGIVDGPSRADRKTVAAGA